MMLFLMTPIYKLSGKKKPYSVNLFQKLTMLENSISLVASLPTLSQCLTAFISQRLNYMKCHWCLHHIQNHFGSFVAIIFHLSLCNLISIQMYAQIVYIETALTAPLEESTLQRPNVSRSPSAPKKKHIGRLCLCFDFSTSKGTDSAFLGWLVCIQFF